MNRRPRKLRKQLSFAIYKKKSSIIFSFEQEKSIVKTYLLIMKKIVEQGIEFVANEKTRLQKLLKDGKVKEKKKMELSQKLNILHSFSLVKDEL